ncbi:MAG: hypothetical protein GY727_02530 [Gammaproteobacteria bacterium]|nr:hypothetical protein [Gammaproteobacteria bacterium]MCP4088797.1 hypothetical protein [Gammaproteobacteria bacterium]MCP4275904.1 hypothetical protein [Gammaproteobacteria bacterium]MCP4832120.1 hypothetical protein [Gammaproteobacteria bacterium]MCP4928279.1 hypothetical protein [Gammaproteobacteria bacterium]
MSDAKQGFFSRYKRWIIAFLLIWLLLLGILILSGDGGNLPFQYQVF